MGLGDEMRDVADKGGQVLPSAGEEDLEISFLKLDSERSTSPKIGDYSGILNELFESDANLLKIKGIIGKSCLIINNFKLLASCATSAMALRDGFGLMRNNPILFTTLASIQLGVLILDYLRRDQCKSHKENYKNSIATLGLLSTISGIGSVSSIFVKFVGGGIANVCRFNVLGYQAHDCITRLVNNKFYNVVLASTGIYTCTKIKNYVLDKVVSNEDEIKTLLEKMLMSCGTKKLVEITNVSEETWQVNNLLGAVKNKFFKIIDDTKNGYIIEAHNSITLKCFNAIERIGEICANNKSEIGMVSLCELAGSSTLSCFTRPINALSKYFVSGACKEDSPQIADYKVKSHTRVLIKLFKSASGSSLEI